MRQRDQKKEAAIRDQAIEMVVKEGLDGLSMSKLARAAGVSPATIYIYFKDRDDLLVQLCVEGHQRMSEETLKGFDPEMSFEEGLRVQWMNRARYFMAHPERMHFLEQIRFSPLYHKALPCMDTTFSNVMSRFVHNAIERKELISLPLEVYWSIAFAPLYQLVKFHMSQAGLPGTNDFVLDKALMNQTLELVLKALKP